MLVLFAASVDRKNFIKDRKKSRCKRSEKIFTSELDFANSIDFALLFASLLISFEPCCARPSSKIKV